jgi:L-threonylcarbamoyladenylate synthase
MEKAPMQSSTTIRSAVTAATLHTAEGQATLAQAAGILRAGGTVAFPTETVYGLGANALSATAVAGIFAAKQRPAWDPLIVHVSDAAMLARVAAEIPPAAQRLMHAFWPGPLTLLLPKHADVPSEVTAGRPLVGVRMPAHPVAHALIAAAQLPIAAPSANRFGCVSPTTAAHVLADLDGRIDMVLDGGPTEHGLESTVLELRDGSAIVYRAGAVTLEALRALLGSVELHRPAVQTTAPESLPSPGVGIRHYAPRARLVLVDLSAHDDAERAALWLQAVRSAQQAAEICGVLLPQGWPLPAEFAGAHFAWGHWERTEELAARLYAGLRTLDAMQVEQILCPLPPAQGLGVAIRDRLHKAAREK